MKKLFLLSISLIIVISLSVFVYLCNINLVINNKMSYEYFASQELIGVDGKINLTGVKKEKELLYNELLNLFNNESYDYDNYLLEIENTKINNKFIQEKIDSLIFEISELEKKKEGLELEYNVLYKKYENIKKNSKSVVTVNTNNSYNFPLINQYPKYQTGCESVALTMLLQYYGVSVTPDMIISKLKKGSVPYWENGILYGGNPELEFVGNPYSKGAYGVYERPMAEVANIYKSGVIAKSNFSFGEVVKIVQSGRPVMVWTSMGLSLPYISSSWIYKPTGETINWKANEHAVVMVGASDSAVTIADPMGGRLKTYSRSTFESRYNYYGKKALYYL